MKSSAAAAVLVAAALSTLPGLALAQEHEDEPLYYQGHENIGLGLFQSVSLSPFASMRTGFGPRMPSSLAEDAVELRINEDWASMLSVKDAWLLDYDVLRSNIGASWGVTDRLRLDLDIESGTRTSGTLDTFIIAFHRTFNLAIGNRRQYSGHPQRLQIRTPHNGPTILVDEHDQQPFQQALIAGAQMTLVRGDEDLPAVAASFSLRRVLDTGDLSLGSAVDVGASLSFAKRAGPVYFYLGGSAAWFGQEDFFGLPLRSLQWSGLFGVEIRAVSWFSITGQYLITSGGVDALQDLSRPAHEVTAGFKWDLGAGYLLETAILENIIHPLNTPDFGVHLGLTIRW
ncbi:MAG: DUF3187 family protein [Planctomycetaceae bacterium]|nr:DUF3187 family protein [Planctomycetaceae bacterium]